MKTIVVSGSGSGVGKTYVAEKLLKALKTWSALKVTVDKGNGCPHDKSCGACDSIKEPFYIIKDDDIINEPGKDTSRLKNAGARQVVWLKSKPDGLGEGLAKVMSEFSDCEGVIIEGTSALKFIKPDLNIHVDSIGNYKIC